MPTLSILWESVNDFIALQGSSGAMMSSVFAALEISQCLQIPIINRLFGSGMFKFLLSRNVPTEATEKALMTFEEFQKDNTISFDTLYCVADVSLSWKAYGFESYHDIPDSQSPLLLSVLEILGMAREKGCSNTEISRLLGIPKLHAIVERIVSLGYVIKQIVLPLNGKGASCRVKSRTVLLHLKRFAAQYDPTVDDIEIEADENMRVDINYYFTKLLNYHNVQEIAATDAAQAIGIGSKKLIKLKDSFASYVKAGLAGICFIDREVPLIYPGRQPAVRMRSCLGFVPSPPSFKIETDHEVAINSPVYELSTAMLRWSENEGISSIILRVKLCLYAKRAARVAIELNTVHGYPMKKQQSGKTLVNHLYNVVSKQPKNRPIQRRRQIEHLQSNRFTMDFEANQEASTHTDREPLRLDDVITNTHDHHATVPFSTASASSLLPDPLTPMDVEVDALVEDDTSSSKKPSTDLRLSRVKCILDTIKKGKGVTSFAEITYWIRLTDTSCGCHTKVDRKTIQRLLDSLQAENKIIQLSAVLPKGIALVITKEGTTITTTSMSLNEAPAEAKLIVHVGDLDPQILLADYMGGLMAALEERKAIIPRTFDRPSRVVRSMIGGENMRNRSRHARPSEKKRRYNNTNRSRNRKSKSRESSSDEDSADSDSDSSDVSINSYSSTGGQSDSEIKEKSRSQKSSSSSSKKRRRAQERADSDDDLPLPLPIPMTHSQSHFSGMIAGPYGPMGGKIDPRVGFLKGGRVRRRKGKDVLERALMKNNKSFTEIKWRISLLGTLTALRPSGLFTAAMHLHFEIANLFFKDKTLAVYEKMQDKPPYTFAASSIISKISLLFAMRNFVCSDHLQRMFVDEHLALIEGRPDDKQMAGLIDAMIADVPLSVYADEEIGLDIQTHILERHLGGLVAVLASLRVIIPPPHVMNMARDLINEHVVRGAEGVEGLDGVEEGVESSSLIPENTSKQPSAPSSSHREDMSRQRAQDAAHVVVGSAEHERILMVFAEAALHAGVNNRRHCSKANKYSELLTLLTYCESELCLDPTGNQGSIWTDGDILHYWKYCVHASLKVVDKDKVKERTINEEDVDDDDGEEFLNKFYTPILSSEITSRWSKIGLDLQEKDFMEVRVVRQRRFLEKERLENMSDSDIDMDNSQGGSGHYMDNSGDETEGTEREDRATVRRDRRAYSVLGFTAMGVAGCVSAQPLDPSIRPRSRALKNKNKDQDKEEEKGREDEGEDDNRLANPEQQTIELRDDWISVPGIGHHTMRGDTFESLQQEEWTNVQNSTVFELFLREYFLKVKTLPTPLFRFFELQKSIKERMYQEQIDEANKEKDKERAKMKKSLREKARLKISSNNEKLLPSADDGKNSQIDLQLIEEFGNHCAADEGEGESSGRSVVHEDSNEVQMTEETPIYDLSNNRIEEPTMESSATVKIAEETVRIAEDTVKVAEDGDVPAVPKSSSPSFLSDPAYALIGRDFGASHITSVVRRMRTFRQQFDVPGKSAQAVSRRFAALLKPGTKNFTESLSVRQTVMLVICHKTPGPPLDRAQAMDPGLRASLNGVLDPDVFARRQEELEREDCASSAGMSLQRDAMYGTSIPLGRAAITRAMQVYSDPEKYSRKRGLDTMLEFPVGAVARAQRELCWNDWIYHPSSKGRRLGPRRGFIMTSSFLGNLISPLCSSFGLLMKPVLHPKRSVTVDPLKNSIVRDKDTEEERKESKKRSRDENDIEKEIEDEENNQNNDSTSKFQKQNHDDDALEMHTDNATTSSAPTTLSAEPQDFRAQKASPPNNPWLYRSILLAELQDESKIDAVNVQEAVMYSHAFATEGVFSSGDITVAVSDFSLTAGALENDAEEKDDDQGESLPGERPADGEPPEDFLRLQARIELIVPLSYKKAFSSIRSGSSSTSSSSSHSSSSSADKEVPEKITKSLCQVHTGKYCLNLNRLHFEVKFIPTEDCNYSNTGRENPLLNIMTTMERTNGGASHSDGKCTDVTDDTASTIAEKDKTTTHTDKRHRTSSSDPSSSLSMPMPDAPPLSAIAVWMRQRIEASGPAGISREALLQLLSDRAIMTADDDTVSVPEGHAPDTARDRIMSAGRELVKRKEIIMDSGDGFQDSGLHCIEPFEKQAVHFVLSSFSSMYSVKTSSSLFPGEGSCPWVLIGGKRNELFYRMLRAKVSSTLSQRPGSSLKSVHAGFPQLSLNQVNILISTMAREGLIYPRKPLTSTRLAGPFQTKSTHASTMGYFLQF